MNPVEKVEIGSTGIEVSRLGWGGSGIGNLYRESNIDEAVAVVDAALAEGINYFDTAPMYGRGLSEERLGAALSGKPRDSFVISTKVSELITLNKPQDSSITFAKTGERSMENDWSPEGTRRSVRESLQRLHLDYVDILYIHDTYREKLELALAGTYPVLKEMRTDGLVKGIGVGMDHCETLCRYVRECELDCILLWGSYSLLNHRAMEELLPLCEEHDVDIISGAPYESGILASDLSQGNVKYRYRDAPEEIVNRAVAINNVCQRFDVPLKAAALQFVFGHPRVRSVIPGTRSPERLRENLRMMAWEIPSGLWSELKSGGLIPENVPTP